VDIYQSIRRMALRTVSVIVIGFVSLSATPVMAQEYAVANDGNGAVVFNAATLALVTTIPLSGPFVDTNYDVAVMPNQSLAFVARGSDIWIIDLTQQPPALASGTNHIVGPLLGGIVEDLSLTVDGRFLVFSDGSGSSPLGVLNTATRTLVGTFNFLPDHNSVEVCDNGSVLVTSFSSNVVRRLVISATGVLTDTGQSLVVPEPNNVACARGGTTAAAVSRSSGQLRTFLVNGMTLVSTQVLPGTSLAINVSISGDGRLFGRRANDFVTAYSFNPTTGVLGPQLWSTNVGARPTVYGVDQMTLNPAGTLLFASAATYVAVMNANTGTIIGSVAALGPTGIAMRRISRGAADFDGDGRSDVALYRPSTSTWYAMQSTSNYTTAVVQTWGLNTDIQLNGDFDGDGRSDPAVYRPSTGTWYLLQSSSNYGTYVAQPWGLTTDITVPGDYDGDGKTDLGLFRPSTGTWYILRSSTNYTTFFSTAFGLNTDVPVPGDYDGDGRTDLAVYRPSTGVWYILTSSTNYTGLITTSFGLSTDITVPGDYDGDGKTDFGLFRPSTATWYVLKSSTNYTTAIVQPFGLGTDAAVPGDYDGDGRIDLAVYRPSTGIWYILGSRTNYTGLISTTFGLSTDVPLLKR
jgi:hypothetical protein